MGFLLLLLSQIGPIEHIYVHSCCTKGVVCSTWGAAPWDLHVELDSVHAQDGMSHMAQHVSTGCYTHKGRQLLQLLELRLPPEQRTRFISHQLSPVVMDTVLVAVCQSCSPLRIRQVDVCAKFNDFPDRFLLSTEEQENNKTLLKHVPFNCSKT